MGYRDRLEISDDLNRLDLFVVQLRHRDRQSLAVLGMSKGMVPESLMIGILFRRRHAY